MGPIKIYLNRSCVDAYTTAPEWTWIGVEWPTYMCEKSSIRMSMPDICGAMEGMLTVRLQTSNYLYVAESESPSTVRLQNGSGKSLRYLRTNPSALPRSISSHRMVQAEVLNISSELTDGRYPGHHLMRNFQYFRNMRPCPEGAYH